MKRNETKQELLLALDAFDEKKAEDIALLSLPSEASALADYFLIGTGNNPPQVQAIADAVDEKLSKQLGVEPAHREGFQNAEWVLLDYVDFVVHIFSANSRRFYDLERLWKSAKHLKRSDLVKAEKKTTAKNSVKKSDAKKAVAKPVVKKAAKSVAKPVAKKTTVKTAAKKSAVKKVAAKKAPAKVVAVKKTVAKKAVAKTVVTKKAAVKKAATKKSSAKKSITRKK